MKQPAHRRERTQTFRKAGLFAAFSLFQLCPLFHLFLSPVVSVVGAFRGVLVASLLTYGLLGVGSLVLGRAFCGWFCPGAAVQECATRLGAHRLAGSRRYWSKYAVFAVWAAAVAVGAIRAGGFHHVDLLFGTTGGGAARAFLFRYGALLVVIPPSLLFGRWASCHYLCWIAPLMVFGRRVGQRAGLPQLRMEACTGNCRRCALCTRACPMSLNVQAMVLAGAMSSDECVLCGSCVAACPSEAVRFAFGRTRAAPMPARNPYGIDGWAGHVGTE